MVALVSLGRLILLLFLLIQVNSCALTENLTATLGGAEPGPEVYYTIPAVTYIRELPGYASQQISTVYHGEPVTVLSTMEDDWCRVQTPAGQIGYIQRALLSPVPLRVETYYIQASEVPLRLEPQEEVISRQILHRGDEVIKLSENKEGWWRVLVEKDKSLGWLPAGSVTGHLQQETIPGVAEKPSEQGAAKTVSYSPHGPKQLFVAINSLKLHLLPLASSEVVKVLQLNEKVDKVYQSGPNWVKVKYSETGVQGWTLASYLSESVSEAPKAVDGKKKKGSPRTRPHDLKKKPLIQPEDLEPEIM